MPPNLRPRVRVLAVTVVAAALAVAAVIFVLRPSNTPADDAAARSVAIGGPFSLTTQNGTPLSDADLKGRPFAIFFGFTHCPEVCPTTLWELSEALKALGPDARDLAVLFVSLDPARDTPEALKSYIASFDGRIIGLTGGEADVATLAKAYRVYWQKVPGEGGDYTLDHTTAVYLMDRTGGFSGLISYEEAADTRIAKLRALAAKS